MTKRHLGNRSKRDHGRQSRTTVLSVTEKRVQVASCLALAASLAVPGGKEFLNTVLNLPMCPIWFIRHVPLGAWRGAIT